VVDEHRQPRVRDLAGAFEAVGLGLRHRIMLKQRVGPVLLPLSQSDLRQGFGCGGVRVMRSLGEAGDGALGST
jgi:hypothetical protein